MDQGPAPRRLVAGKMSDGKAMMTRPVFRYPLEAKYVGHGSTNVAKKFTAVTGSRGRRTSVDLDGYQGRRCRTLC